MADRYESSGLHSLAVLAEGEKRRAQERAEAARARAEAEQRARLEAERVEHERRVAEHLVRSRAESDRQAERLLLEAAQRAEFERAEGLLRASDELKSQLECERVARRGIELSLTSQLLRQRLWAGASLALCLTGASATAALYFGALRPNAERAVASLERSVLGERRARLEAEQREIRARLRADELSSKLDSLSQAARGERDGRSAPDRPGAPKKPAIRQPGRREPNDKPCRDDGDPLNPCLKR